MSYISYYNRKVSQPPTRQSSRKGTGRRTIGQRANHTIHLETEEVTKTKKPWAHWHIKKLFYLDQLLWVTEMPNPNPFEQCYETVREHLYDDPQLNENQFLKSQKRSIFKDRFLLYLTNLNNLRPQLPPLSQSHLPSP